MWCRQRALAWPCSILLVFALNGSSAIAQPRGDTELPPIAESRNIGEPARVVGAWQRAPRVTAIVGATLALSGAVAVTAGVPFVNRHYDIAARFFVAGGVMGAVGIVTMIAGWQLEHGWERRRGLAPLPRIRRRRLWSAGFALVGLGIAAMIGGFRFDHGYSDVGRIVGGALFGILGSVGAMLLIWGTYAGRQSEIALHVGPSSIALDLRF